MMHSLGTAIGASELCAAAFRQLNTAILSSAMSTGERPRNALRTDETIWGRGPARIELGGGWTDTPPYTLEYGGDVINVAVNLNGQPPIHCYCRVVEDPVIRLSSIDGGRHVEIRSWMICSIFSVPRTVSRWPKPRSRSPASRRRWPPGRRTSRCARMLEEFGGGIELTTLVGIPKGSGLGTSSILGAVIMAVLRRMTGRPQSRRELFHDVLRLEQALTTGGGWQDQIGGGVGGAKITSTRPGLFPDPSIHYVPADVVDPKANGGSTLLYYTGLTRLAKNILQQIVGGYLNRDRAIMQALAEEHQVAHSIADAMARKDAAAFGQLRGCRVGAAEAALRHGDERDDRAAAGARPPARARHAHLRRGQRRIPAHDLQIAAGCRAGAGDAGARASERKFPVFRFRNQPGRAGSDHLLTR